MDEAIYYVCLRFDFYLSTDKNDKYIIEGPYSEGYAKWIKKGYEEGNLTYDKARKIKHAM